ncbi:MAG: hypothetical protein FJ279_33285, partial [Planctomycetes bacterium]|nr:hypothetical protein [Planctomycetota bacterium]
MTAKERVLRAIAHQETDRVPVHIHLTPEIGAKLKEALKGRNPAECFSDLRFVGAVYRGKTRKPEPGSGVDSYDQWGIGYRRVSNEFGTYSEAVEWPWAKLHTLSAAADYPWPKASDFDFSGIPAACERLKGFPIVFGGAGTPDIINGTSRGRG